MKIKLKHLVIRYHNSQKFMDQPYREKWTGEKLEQGIEERMKYVPVLNEIAREATYLVRAIKEQTRFKSYT